MSAAQLLPEGGSNTPPRLDAPIGEHLLCFLDLETTGSGYRSGNRIVEISLCLRAPDGAKRGPFTRRVNPGREIPWQASRVHGLRDRDVARELPFRARAARLAELCQGAVLIAHNGRACDEPMLRAELDAAGVPWPFLAAIDTLPLARTLWPDRSHRLEPLARSLGVSCGEAHTAEGDVLTLLGLFDAIVGELGRETPLSALTTTSTRRGRKKDRPRNPLP